MNHRLALATALALALFAVPAAYSCDLCSIYAALDARESHPGWYASLFEQYTRFETLRQDGEEVENEVDQSLESSITQLIVGYQFDPRWGVQVNLPLIDRSFRRPEGEGIERNGESGIGDATLLAHWRAFERVSDQRITTLSLLFGVKAPTGSTTRRSTRSTAAPPFPSPAAVAGWPSSPSTCRSRRRTRLSKSCQTNAPGWVSPGALAASGQIEV